MDVSMGDHMIDKWVENFRYSDPYQSVLKDPKLRQYLCQRWYYLRCTSLTNSALVSIIEEAVPRIKEAVLREAKHGFEEELNRVREWVKRRPGWFDGELPVEFGDVSQCKPSWYPSKCSEAKPPVQHLLVLDEMLRTHNQK
jgi:hypothetical protein